MNQNLSKLECTRQPPDREQAAPLDDVCAGCGTVLPATRYVTNGQHYCGACTPLELVTLPNGEAAWLRPERCIGRYLDLPLSDWAVLDPDLHDRTNRECAELLARGLRERHSGLAQ